MKRTIQLLASLFLILGAFGVKADTETGGPGYRRCQDHATNICYQVKNIKGEVIEKKTGMPYTTNL
ncbi:hypothetical protein SOM16_13470 [Pedobacter sp. CFBP9032]|nr:hypothetical protein [Pedobacter sp. CFBP9032]